MASIQPPDAVLSAFTAGVTDHTRRVEVYEADGVTPWRPGVVVSPIDGSISVSYGDNERRTIEMTIDNSDNLIATKPGGLWYDKVIKVFRGVKLKDKPKSPRIAMLTIESEAEYENTFTPFSMRAAFGAIGYGDIEVVPHTTPLATILGYDIVISQAANASGGSWPAAAAMIALQKNIALAGTPLFTLGVHGNDYIDAFPTGSTLVNANYVDTNSIYPRPIPHPLTQGWGSFQMENYGGAATGTFEVINPGPWTAAKPWTVVAQGDAAIPALSVLEGIDTKWVTFQFDILKSQLAGAPFWDIPDARMMLLSVMNYLNPTPEMEGWETQVGEFMIDRITQDHFPNHIKITGRDYVKKCSSSKYLFATKFDPGLTREGIVASIAGAAGITKRVLPITGITITKSFYFDRGVTRWDAMREIVAAYDYEIFFDAQGFLVMQSISDPALTTPSFTLRTGSDGVLVSFSKSTTDTRIYNVVVVTGESSDPDTLPVWATARNDNPLSPTSVQKIGERVYQYVSSWITTTAQAQTVADSFLAVHALEEFEISFDALMMPWLEVGDIVGFEDPDPNDDAPSTLLFSAFTIPIGLGSMSGSGKRVVKLG